MKKYIPILALLVLFWPSSTKAVNNPAALGVCAIGTPTTCSFTAPGGGYNYPAANQAMIVQAFSTTGACTLSVSDTYGLSFTAFSVATGYWWAKTGSHSGADTVTINWGVCTPAFIMVSTWYCVTQVDCTAANLEDTSTFVFSAAGLCANSISYTLNTSGGPVVSNIQYDSFHDAPGTGSTSGLVQNTASTDDIGFFNISGFNFSTGAGTFISNSAGAKTTGWTWSSCSGSSFGTTIVVLALKGPLTARAVKHKVKNIYN